jgi:hypothetical protein
MKLIGIYNPNSRMKSYGKQGVNLPMRRTVTTGDIEVLAVAIGAKLQVALFHKDSVRVREFDSQLLILAAELRRMKAG